MALTKVTGQVIKNTTDVTVGVLTVTNTLAVGGTVSIGGTLTYEDVTNVDAVGLITARNGIVVGSGITLSKDGDGFFTGVVTATTFKGDGTGLTGVAGTENIRTNTNATFLQNINVGVAITAGKLGIGFTDNNVKVGNTALDSLTTGTNNVAVGNAALTATTTNSSPPILDKISVVRKLLCMTLDVSTRALSPNSWPNVSFIIFIPSRSKKKIKISSF